MTPEYIQERLNKLIADGEVLLKQYNQKGNIDKHDLWITEVRNFFSVIGPEYNKKLNDIADKLKDYLIEEPYGRAAYNYIQQQIEVTRLAKDALIKNAKESDLKKDKKGRQQMTQFFSNLKANEIWLQIEKEYDVSKRSFARKINFVSDGFKRKIIFRDIEQSYILAASGFPKPAVILAGNVIEELLRLFLKHKNIIPTNNNFDSYIKACEQNGLLKLAINRLTDSVRYFRNVVHLEKENSPRISISKATAKGAVASIFTITNDF